MKKSIVLIISLFSSIGTFYAQNIEESTYIDKNKVMESLSFSSPVCNKDVLVDTWKKFIKRQGGKVKGGLINKANGSNIVFVPEGESWSGYFVYEYNEDKTMTLFTSFQNLQGNFINSENSEKEIAIPILENFRMDIIESCALDDLIQAKNYSISLDKERIRNSDRIVFLEKTIHDDQQKLGIASSKELTEKEEIKVSKIKQRIISNEVELQGLKKRNSVIDEELKSQILVIQNFQDKVDTLQGKTIFDEEVSVQEIPIDFDNSGDQEIKEDVEEESVEVDIQ